MGKVFNFQFHKGIFLAEILYLVSELGDLDAELHRKKHQEDEGKKEKGCCRESGSDKKGE